VIRPRLLDLFCCAGGAGMGYHRAGFEVVGVDAEPMPRYPFEFHQADALEFLAAHWQEFDAVHASPPCHDHSKLQVTTGIDYGTGDLLGKTLDLLLALGVPFIVENVDSASVRAEMARAANTYAVLCGSMFGLEVRHGSFLLQVRRHRLFATSFRGTALDVTGHGMQGREYRRRRELGLPFDTLADRREAMGIDWTDREELSEAIPPAFTEYLGGLLLDHLTTGELTA
jgi:DNA (cytosine-5)-methyltransferase 1